MLLNFSIQNYKSFWDKASFSMTPAPRQSGLDYSIQSEKIGSKTYRGLSSAVIYGPNAAGKTNLIGAMDTMKSIVLRGNIKNAEAIASPNQAAYLLEVIPNCDAAAAPVTFSVRFLEQGLVFDYAFSAMLGGFLEKNFTRYIETETLSINEKLVFDRTRNGFFLDTPAPIRKYVHPMFKKTPSAAIDIAMGSLSDDELFLCNGFKSIVSKELVSILLNWFENKFTVIYRADAMQTMRRFADPADGTIYVEKTLTEAAKAFGITANALGYRTNGEDVALCSLLENKNIAILAESFESYGTIRFVHEFPLIIRALLTGGTLVMDEFDASIHPIALMNIVNAFHNDEINLHHAQLIFNTHNPIFLDASLFRRDEIKFVERSRDTNRSIHYALSDFKTSNGVRKGEDYMSNYFVSRYGAIEDVDFTPLLKKVVQESAVHTDG